MLVPKFNCGVEKGVPGHETWKNRSILVLGGDCRVYRYIYYIFRVWYYPSFQVSARHLGTHTFGVRKWLPCYYKQRSHILAFQCLCNAVPLFSPSVPGSGFLCSYLYFSHFTQYCMWTHSSLYPSQIH